MRTNITQEWHRKQYSFHTGESKTLVYSNINNLLNIVLYNILEHNIVLYDMLEHYIVLYDMLEHNIVLYDILEHNIVLYDTLEHNIVLSVSTHI